MEKNNNNFMICYNVENMRTSSRLPESEKKWLLYLFMIFSLFLENSARPQM